MRRKYFQGFIKIVSVGILVLPLLLFSRQYFLRPAQANLEKPLFQGIVYKRETLKIPRPVMVHVVTVDLTQAGVKTFVTPKANSRDVETTARTASEFLREFNLQLAINANYFHRFDENTPWDYFPHSGDPSYPIGEVISNGNRYSKGEKSWPVLCVLPKNRAQILDSEKCPEGTFTGVAGRNILVARGKAVVEKSKDDEPYNRVAVAVDKKGEKMWLIVVDGKQIFYSEGLTNVELAKFIANLGAQTALNLDGGGSTTLVMAENNEAKVLNSPSHTKIPMRERPVANHLGFYALPIEQK